MKSPTTCSIPIPHLLDIGPFEDFEFSFPSEELWWDDQDTDTSDYFSAENEDYSATPSTLDTGTFSKDFFSQGAVK